MPSEGRGGLGEVVGVVAGRVGHGQQLAGTGVLDDHVTAVGLGLGDLVADGLLGGPLDVAVDGQLDVGTGHGRDLAASGGGDAAAAGLGVADLAVLARELLVELRFESAAALAVGADESQYPGGEVPVGVDPLGGRLLEDPGQDVGARAAVALVLQGLLREDGLEVLDLLPDLGGLPVGEHGVAALGGGELLDELVDVLAEDRGEQGGGLLGRVGGLALLGREHFGVGRDVVRVDAGGQGDALAVGDLPALGGDRVLQVAVLLGLGGVRGGVDGLDLEEPGHEEQHDQREPEADEPEPGARAAQAQGAGRAPACGGAAGGGAGAAGRGACAGAAVGPVTGARRTGYAAARRFLGRHCVTCRGWSGAGSGSPGGSPRRGRPGLRAPGARRVRE